MSNERLQAALQAAGLQPDDLADQLDVDVKTVRRWLSGRLPTSRHRARTIEILGPGSDLTEQDLWPEVAPPTIGDDSRDLIAIYARSDDARAPDWRALLQTAHRRIDLLDTTLTDILTTVGTVELLLEKARAGAQVRVLIAHPQSIWTAALAEQLGADERDESGQTQIERDISLSLGYLERLIDQPRIACRTHWAERTHTVLRFDDEMLVTVNLHGTPTAAAPLLHLRRRGSGTGIFDQILTHLARVEHDASEALEAPGRP
jgi:transcriptional regulator with XRE-family HTH domain